MFLKDFNNFISALLKRARFKPLLQNPSHPGSPAWEYLASRGLSEVLKNLEFYDFNGKFNYNNREYNLPNSLVIPLRSRDGKLRGAWIRFLEQKRFFIWMVDSNFQKYWVDIKDPNKEVYLCEGILDALSLKILLGIDNIAACCGVHASGELINELQDHDVVLCLDNDRPGIQAMLGHLSKQQTQHWKVLDCGLDINQEKDYNEVLKNNRTLSSRKLLESISAKIFLKSKL